MLTGRCIGRRINRFNGGRDRSEGRRACRWAVSFLPLISFFWLSCAGSPPPPSPLLPPSLSPAPFAADLDAFTAGLHFEMKGEYESALAAYVKALRADPENAYLLARAAACHMELKQFDEAAAIAFRSLEADSTQAEAHWIRGLSLARSNLLQESLPDLEDAVRLEPSKDLYLGSLIQVLTAAGQMDLATETLERILGTGSESSRWLFRLGMYLLQRNHESSALKMFRRVVQNDPQNAEAWILIGDIEGKSGRPAEGAEAYLQALRLRPESPKIARQVLPLLIFEEKWEDAADVLSLLNDGSGSTDQEMLKLAQWLLSQNEPAKAKALLEFLKKESSDSSELRRVWMQTLILQGSPSDVYRASRDLLDLVPGDAEGLRVGAAAMADSGRIEESLEMLGNLLKRYPRDIQGYMLLGEIESRRDHWEDALQAFRLVLEIDSTRVRALFQEGVSLERLGRFDEAIDTFQRLIAMEPDNHQALNYMGYMCIDLGIHLPEAMEWIKEALEIRPDTPAYLDSLGWGYYQLKQYNDALTWLLKSVEGGGNDPEIYLHVAGVLKELGRIDEAIDWVHRVLRHRPDHVGALQFLQDLEGVREGVQ
ncbi:MAG: tetratricopeptide repeat protein [Candidatus Eisenbacteria bacterium]|uniref:Tetratricopeptide repeat protein n=1 Tax=Eiseniibacteriota bacterium TaxID=2212470 RepID=A0A948RVS4_UNCEI|nr:tetratricopeptide repeat protein [Candidatus Eisenbacteria bacterium]MBU1948915.1 tetratricopeptide repeat protein [Candidatus Eisenbacteria bacterium]MBU2690599.1 tetratricopeptide repeat protein [Candidatus Eisenbacteria bacterium]